MKEELVHSCVGGNVREWESLFLLGESPLLAKSHCSGRLLALPCCSNTELPGEARAARLHPTPLQHVTFCFLRQYAFFSQWKI